MAKRDWTGNKHAAFITNADTGHSEEERETNDYYATDPTAIDDLLHVEYFDRDILIHEPACGEGHLAKRLQQYGFQVLASDLIDRGYGQAGVDFLGDCPSPMAMNIITNPPYSLALEFVKQALRMVKPGCKVAMFLKLTFLEGVERAEYFKQVPIKTVHVYSYRKACGKNGDFTSKWGSAICYAWFIWEKGYQGPTTLSWITKEDTQNYVQGKLPIVNS